MKRFMSAYDREFYGSIRRENAGCRARYFTTVLTDVWLWARVQEYLKRTHWIRYFLTIIEKKGYTWTSKVETLGDDKEASKVAKYMRDTNKGEIAAASRDLLNIVDVTTMVLEGYNLLMKKKNKGLCYTGRYGKNTKVYRAKALC